MIEVYQLPSKYAGGIIKEKENTFLTIKNMGDVEMPFSVTLTKKGTYSFCLDGVKMNTIENKSSVPIKIDGFLEAFFEKENKQSAKKVYLLNGSFFKIPIGEHRLSILINGKHCWSSEIVEDFEFNYLYL